jgi:hypothetical protein
MVASSIGCHFALEENSHESGDRRLLIRARRGAKHSPYRFRESFRSDTQD